MPTTKTRKTARRRRRAARRIEAAAANKTIHLVDPDAEQLTLEAAAAADDGKEGPKVRRFAMRGYTGGKLLVAGYLPYGVIVDLAGLTVGAKSRPILRDHDPGRIVGHTTDVKISAGSISLSGVVSGSNEHAREVEASADAGFPWQASIGAKPTQLAFVDRGEKVQVNGRTFTGPVYVARKSTLREFSFVAVGADDDTSARMLAAANRSEEMEFDAWLEENGFDPKGITAAQRKLLQATYDAEIAAADADDLAGGNGRGGAQGRSGGKKGGKPKKASTVRAAAGDGGAEEDESDPVGAYREQIAAESERVSLIRAKVSEYGVSRIKVGEQEVDLESHAIRAGWSAEQVELHALRASRGTGPAIHSRTLELQSNPLEAALLMSVGLSEDQVGKLFKGDEKVVNAALDRKYRGAGLHMLMDACIHAAGKHFSGNRKSDEFILEALEADKEIRASSGFSTLSVSGILSNVANKTLLASYEAVPVVWPQICGVRSHSDFKAQTRYRLDSTGAFKKVGPDGELKHVGLAEGSFSAQLDTFGAILALTRQDQINDDLDAFTRIPMFIGRMAATRMEEAVFVLLLSNAGSFFSVGNANLLTGAGSALGIDGYTDGETAFANQVDSNNKPILVQPAVLLTGTTLKVTADNLAKETKIQSVGSTDAQHFTNNPHAGKFKPVSSPYVNNTAIRDQDGLALTGQSDDQWFLFADPAVRAAITIAFLNGRRVPTMAFAETDFNTLGMQWRGFHDFGVAFEDPKAGQKNAGS